MGESKVDGTGETGRGDSSRCQGMRKVTSREKIHTERSGFGR